MEEADSGLMPRLDLLAVTYIAKQVPCLRVPDCYRAARMIGE
jgi:hypothetical protein